MEMNKRPCDGSCHMAFYYWESDMQKTSRIFVAGHNGLVGSALVRKLRGQGYKNLLLCSHNELDLTVQEEVYSFFLKYQPEYVFLAAAMVGGICANDMYPAEFIYNNIQIQANVIHIAYKCSVKRLVFLGSSCVYPKYSPQPIEEKQLLAGPLEPTNESYAIAKIAGIMMCRAYNRQFGTEFISVMPTNLYGPNDNYDLEKSHVLPALIRKIHEAKINNLPTVILWGTGTPKREFLYVDDLAEACIEVANYYKINYHQPMPIEEGVINIGSGEEVTIFELALIVKNVVGYKGEIQFEKDKPDGTPRKFIDSSKIYKLGWKPRVSLFEGIKLTYEEYRLKHAKVRGGKESE